MPTLIVKQSGGDYSSLNAALNAAVNGDVISIEGSWTASDTTACTISDTNITIQIGDEDAAHPGHWDTSLNHYRLVVSSGVALTVNGGLPIIKDLAIGQNGTGNAISVVVSTTVEFSNLLLLGNNGSTSQDGIYFYYSHNQIIRVTNCVIRGFGRSGLRFSQHGDKTNGSTECRINSCLFTGNNQGITIYSAASGLKPVSFGVHNTISMHNTRSDLEQTNNLSSLNRVSYGTTTFDVSYSIDSDGSIGAVGVNDNAGNLNNRTLTDNVSPGAGDWVIVENITTPQYSYKLKQSPENDAEDVHTTTTAEGSSIPSTDIIGVSRPNHTYYDIGPFEIIYLASDTLSADSIISSSFTSESVFGQRHNLVGADSVSFFVIDNPDTLGQNHFLIAVNAVSNSVVTLADISQLHNLSPSNLIFNSITTESLIGQIHALLADHIVSQSFAESTILGFIFHLTANGIVATPAMSHAEFLTLIAGFMDVDLRVSFIDVIFDSNLLQ